MKPEQKTRPDDAGQSTGEPGEPTAPAAKRDEGLLSRAARLIRDQVVKRTSTK